jgi:hypothetical protein
MIVHPIPFKMKQIATATLNSVFRTLAFSAALMAASSLSNAQVCNNPGSVIYALSNSGNVYPVTVSTGAVAPAVNSTSLGSTSSANGIGYNTVNGLFYYFQNANNGGSQQFVSFNPITNTYTTLAPAPITGIAYKGCVSFNGTGYYCLDAKGNLCYYDITTNTWVLTCSSFMDQYGNNAGTIFSNEYSGDIAIDGLGNMWIVTSSPSTWGLYKLSAPLPTTIVSSLTVKQLVVPTTATPTGVNFVGIAFDPTGNIYMGTNNDLYLLQNNFSLTHLAAFSTGGICGDLTSCNYPFGILAVSFQNIAAVANENKSVSVSWVVSEQAGTKGYYVEHSTNGSSWNQLGFEPGGAAGESNAQYSFVDNNPDNGTNFYRIEELDIDGSGNYSETRTVSIKNAASSHLQVWPNPAKGQINIQNNNNYISARIYTQSGALAGESALKQGANAMNVSALRFGAYIVNVKDANGNSYNMKFIKE